MIEEINRLYLLVGFLLGSMIMGCISIVMAILYHEWMKKPDDSDGL
jgi:hypothetical protein